MRNRNVLKCPVCGFEVFTEASDRDCARCKESVKMKYVCKEDEYKRREDEK